MKVTGKAWDEPESGYDPNKPYDNRDPRMEMTIAVNGEKWPDTNPNPLEIYIGGRNALVLYLDFLILIFDGGEKTLQLIVIHIRRIQVVDTIEEVAKNIHIVGESIERIAVDTTVKTYIAWFGGHEAEVVACLQVIPVLIDTRIVGNADTVGNTIKLASW